MIRSIRLLLISVNIVNKSKNKTNSLRTKEQALPKIKRNRKRRIGMNNQRMSLYVKKSKVHLELYSLKKRAILQAKESYNVKNFSPNKTHHLSIGMRRMKD